MGCLSKTQGTLGACFVTVLFWANLLRINPEVAPAVISVFWLDAVFIAAAIAILMCALMARRSIKFGWVIFALGIWILAVVPLCFGAFEQKVTYSLRLVFVSFFLPVLFSIWFRTWTSVPIYYARIVVVSAVPVGAIVFFQLLHFFPFTDWVHFLWGSEKLRSLQSSSPRVYGSFLNANWFGVYAVFLAVCTWGLFQMRQIGKYSFAMNLLISFAFILISGSRTAVIGVAVAGASALLVVSAQRSRFYFVRTTLGMLLGFATILLGVQVLLEGSRLLRRWLELFTGDVVVSAEGRFKTWSISWSRVWDNPVVGSGVSGVPHNSYLATLEAFGLIAGGLVLGLYVALVGSSWVLAKKREASIAVPILTAFSVMALTAEFFYTTQLMILVVPMLMWVVSSLTGPTGILRNLTIPARPSAGNCLKRLSA